MWSEAQRIEILSTLVRCDGMPKHAAKRLEDQGINIEWTEVRRLRDAHQTTYQALASELRVAQEEALAVEFRELARLGQKVTRNYLEDLLEQQESEEGLDRETQRQLPQVIQAMGKVMQVGTDKLLSLTGRPVDGSGADPLKAAQQLIDMGVLEPVQRPALPTADADSTAEEVS